MLGISRGSVYYKPRPVPAGDLKLMHRIDKLHMEFPFAGSRMLQGLLVQEGFRVGRLHVDEAHGDRGPLPSAEHLGTGAGAQDLPLSAEKAAHHPAQPSLGDGHHLHSDGARMAGAPGATTSSSNGEPLSAIGPRTIGERRTIKYEEVYLQAYAGVSEARAGIGRYLGFHNSRRPHTSLDGKTPDQADFNQPMPQAAAA